ncbi:MAG: ABC transporter ATP-binding protein [Firmicutes bacterium]|nr:ABC transporter ATP-binding protein [Bacillota bacterium]MBR2593318.1 ABC transporter ATP-binding protein [Bacillota bacterium]
MLKIDDIVVKYDTIPVVKGVSMEVEEGELVALIGANGAGKSTILKTISGLMRPAQGKIMFNDMELSKMGANDIVKAGVVQVPEGRQIFSKMTVYENLRLGAFLRKDRAEFQKNIDYVFEMFPILKERLKQQAGTLSGGEQQMLAMGRALMSCPKFLLLDEPSMGLSPIMTEQVFSVIKTLKSHGITMLLVEQNAFEALEVADRAYILETGNITLSGNAQDLIKNPAVKEAYLGG